MTAALGSEGQGWQISCRAGLVKSGSGSEIVVFSNVDHGFNAGYRPTYDKAAATYAQKLTTDWLKERGV